MPSSKYFKNTNSIEDLKKQYRKLAMIYRPDVSKEENAEAIMKKINNEYEQLFVYISAHQTDKQRETAQKQGHAMNDGYREFINKIIHIPDVEIEICGSWIWISGETKPYKDIIKNAGAFWASKKTMWYWRPQEYKQTFNKKSMSMDYIREKYGSEKIQNQPHQQVSA